MKLKNFYYVFLAGILLLFPKNALATVTTEFGPVNGVTDYVTQIFDKLIVPVVGGLALLMIIYAGYLYITSQGNPDSVNRAKDILIGVITGIILLFLIKLILNTLIP